MPVERREEEEKFSNDSDPNAYCDTGLQLSNSINKVDFLLSSNFLGAIHYLQFLFLGVRLDRTTRR